MATRFYLPFYGTSPVPALAFSSGWETTTSAVRRPLRRTHTGTMLASGAALAFPSTTSQQRLFYQYVSEPLASAQSISGTISMVLSCMEADLTADAHLCFLAYVVAADGTNPRTLLSYMTTSTEMATSLATRIHSARAISTVAAARGDRIVIELGAHGDSPATGYAVTLRVGDPRATDDFALTSGLTTDLVPWVELSCDLTFGALPAETRPLFDGGLAITAGGLDVTAEALKARLSTTMPGGFGEASFRLPAASPFGPYSLSVGRTQPVVITHGEQTLFEGEIANDVSVATIAEGEAHYDVVAAGKWYAARQRADGLAAYCDMAFDQWEMSTRGQPNAFDSDTDGRLAVVAKRGRQFNSPNGGAGPYYWMHKGLGDQDLRIDHLIFELGDYGNGDVRGLDLALSGDWRMSIQAGANPWDSALAAEDVYSPPQQVAAGTFYRSPNEGIGYTFGVGTQCVRFRLYPINDNTPTGDRYLIVRRIWVMYTQHERIISTISSATPAVVTTSTAHGLKTGDRVYIWGGTAASTYQGVHRVESTPTTTTFTIAAGGTAGTGGYMERIPSPVDAMVDIGEGVGGVTATVDDSCYAAALPGSVMVRPHTAWADALAELERRFSTPVLWAWWDGGVFDMDTLPASPSATYEVDAALPGVTYDVHRDTEGQPVYVRVLYTLDDSTSELHGQVVQTAVPSDPGYDIGDGHVAVLDLSGSVLTTDDAEEIGARYLAWEGSDVWVGSIIIKTPTVDVIAGGTYETAYLRAGEWIREANALSALYITTTEYDVDSSTMTLTIGAPPGEFDPQSIVERSAT